METASVNEKKKLSKNSILWVIAVLVLISSFIVGNDEGISKNLIGIAVIIPICLILGFILKIFGFSNGINNARMIFIVMGIFATIMSVLMPESSNSGNSYSSYPKSCKAHCGYSITSDTYDDDGYHNTCKPGKDGRSTMDRLK